MMSHQVIISIVDILLKSRQVLSLNAAGKKLYRGKKWKSNDQRS